MVRPDQERFDQFSRHLDVLDDDLRRFCEMHGFSVEKNANRHPCRVLRKQNDLTLVIDIYLDGYWLDMDYQEDLPHNVGVAAYYRPKSGNRLVRKADLIEHEPFSILRGKLSELLIQAVEILQSWLPPGVPSDDPDSTVDEWSRTIVY